MEIAYYDDDLKIKFHWRSFFVRCPVPSMRVFFWVFAADLSTESESAMLKRLEIGNVAFL